MNLAVTVLSITAPVFLLAAFGVAWVRLGYEYPLQFVTRLAMTLAVPCLIFTALMNAEANLGELGQVALAGFAAYLAICAVTFLGLRLAGLELRTYLAPLTFGNTGNLGLPLCLFAFGQKGLEAGVVILGVTTILVFSIGIRFVAGRGAWGRILREPMLWATALGALFLWQGWTTPPFLTNTLTLAGQMAIPLMLVTLGVAVARLNAAHVGRALMLSVAKFLACAAIAAGIGIWFDLSPVLFGVLVLQMATPVGVSSYLLATKYEADAEAVAGIVVLSTLLAVPGLSLLLAFLL